MTTVKQLRNRLRKAKVHAMFERYYGSIGKELLYKRIVRRTHRELRNLHVVSK